MKKILLIITAFVFAISANAQHQVFVAGQSTIYQKTVLQVTVNVKKEVIKSGPYARYAQQYLGVVVNLSDKTEYSITSSNISVAESTYKYKNNSYSSSSNDYNNISSGNTLDISRTSLVGKSIQAMASDAAQAIFNIRRKKMDLITGETQEAYGAGVEAAIKEMNKLEQQYIDLFMGEKSVSYSQHEYGLVPNKENKSYVLTRFSKEKGILDILSSEGNTIVLTLTPEKGIGIHTDTEKRATYSLNSPVIMPEWATATLINGSETIGTSLMQIAQFGKIIEAATK